MCLCVCVARCFSHCLSISAVQNRLQQSRFQVFQNITKLQTLQSLLGPSSPDGCDSTPGCHCGQITLLESGEARGHV